MNVSSPPVLGDTAQHASRRPAAPINNLASTESQGFFSDHFETSSQFSESDCSDIGDDIWEPRAIISDCSEHRSPLNLSDTEDHFLDDVSIQREASKSVTVDGFSASQPENPFQHTTVALPPRPLPTPPKQQEVTDSTGQHSLNERPRIRIRLSRPEQSQGVSSFEQTDAERESRGKKIMKSARQSLCKEKSIKNTAKIAGSNGQSPSYKRIRLSRNVLNQGGPFSQRTDGDCQPADQKTRRRTKRKSKEITDPNGQHPSYITIRLSRLKQYQGVPSSQQTDDECESSDGETRKSARMRLCKRRSKMNKSEITDSNGQHPSYRTIRLSRHKQYQGVPSSEQTDDDYDSTNEEVRKNAKQRLSRRRAIKNKAKRTDSNEQHPSHQRIRFSRHETYQTVPSSEQTDDERESSVPEIREKARQRLSKRKQALKKAQKAQFEPHNR
jgi:hypothetical protein